MTLKEKLLVLARQLYPSGRAYRMSEGGYLEGLHKALGMTEERAYNDFVSVLDNLLPDNANFSIDDATDWERRLGMITNISLSLDERKAAIYRKMNFPGGQPARQNKDFIQWQLQLAKFNVFIYENIFSDGMGGYISKQPLDITGGVGGSEFQHGDFEHGTHEHGIYWGNIIANKINETEDNNFVIPNDLSATFFVGGATLGSFAAVDLNRKNEFRQLLLTLKPASTVGFLMINYV
jgi:hypothetical protein